MLSGIQSACAILFCHLSPTRLCCIFTKYLINGTIFGEKLLSIKCLFLFSLRLLRETLLILRRTERDVIELFIGLHLKYRCYSCQILMELELSRQTYEKL